LADIKNNQPTPTWSSFYVAEPPRYYPLGGGRYWLKDVGSGGMTADTTGTVALQLSVPEGSFRVLSSLAGDSLILQRFQANATWHPVLWLSLRGPVDSLVARHGRNHERGMRLAAPIEVQAGGAGCRLRLFITSINREEFDHEPRYSYMADGLLEVGP
jgi:hypothetical protein